MMLELFNLIQYVNTAEIELLLQHITLEANRLAY